MWKLCICLTKMCLFKLMHLAYFFAASFVTSTWHFAYTSKQCRQRRGWSPEQRGGKRRSKWIGTRTFPRSGPPGRGQQRRQCSRTRSTCLHGRRRTKLTKKKNKLGKKKKRLSLESIHGRGVGRQRGEQGQYRYIPQFQKTAKKRVLQANIEIFGWFGGPGGTVLHKEVHQGGVVFGPSGGSFPPPPPSPTYAAKLTYL